MHSRRIKFCLCDAGQISSINGLKILIKRNSRETPISIRIPFFRKTKTFARGEGGGRVKPTQDIPARFAKSCWPDRCKFRPGIYIASNILACTMLELLNNRQMTTEILSRQLSGVYSWICQERSPREAKVHAHMRLVEMRFRRKLSPNPRLDFRRLPGPVCGW